MITYKQSYLITRAIERQFSTGQRFNVVLENFETIESLLCDREKKESENFYDQQSHQDSLEQCVSSIKSIKPLLELIASIQENDF